MGSLVGSGWVLELKNYTSKIIEIHFKKQCFGLRRLQDGAKMALKMHCFGMLKSYEFTVQKQCLGSMSVIQNIDNL